MRRIAVCWVVVCTLFLQGLALVGFGDTAHAGSTEVHTSTHAAHAPDHLMDDSCEGNCPRMSCQDMGHCIAASVLTAVLPVPLTAWPVGVLQAPCWPSEPSLSGRTVHDVWRPPILA